MASTINIPGKDELLMPLGYRFRPLDHELMYHLKQKVVRGKVRCDPIPTVPNLFGLNPDQIPSIPLGEHYAEIQAEPGFIRRQWFFYTTDTVTLEEDGGQVLTADGGYWEFVNAATPVEDPNTGTTLGFKHALHFYNGIFPDGIKSGWAIYEYRLNLDALLQEDDKITDETKHKVQTFVVCCAVKKERRVTRGTRLALDGIMV